MSKEKQIQIPQKLFLEITQYFILNQRSSVLEESIAKGIEDKFDALLKHELYTKYKTAPTEEQKEQARKEYLEKIGVSDAFRW